MAYNIPNWGFITSGSTIGVGFWWGGADQGAQFAMGSPQDNGGDLVSSTMEKSLDLEGNFAYAFQLTNNGSDTWFALEGGGLS
jgi:hypothetical protein